MVNQIYPPELQLNKANISDTEAPFLDLHLSVANGFVSSKIYDKRDDFDFDIVNFPFLDGDVPRRASYGVYISQLIRFARVCNHVTDFNARNKCLTAKLLQQGYRYHKLRKIFSKFYRRHYELISKYNVGLKTLLNEGLSEPEFYGDLVYKFKKLIGSNDFSFQFGKIITRYRRIGYNLNVMRQSACLVFNPIMVDNYAAFFNCTPVGRASDSMMAAQMKFNVAECHSMRVTRHLPSNQIHFNYSLLQQTLEQVRSAKYLGLTITDDLEWGQHISEISCKATKTLGFLRRNLALAPRHTKEVAYKTLVRPQLEYAAPIWHPYDETEKKKVEKVQKTAARWTCRRWHNKSSVDDMLDELEWPSGEVFLNFLLQDSLRYSVS